MNAQDELDILAELEKEAVLRVRKTMVDFQIKYESELRLKYPKIPKDFKYNDDYEESIRFEVDKRLLKERNLVIPKIVEEVAKGLQPESRFQILRWVKLDFLPDKRRNSYTIFKKRSYSETRRQRIAGQKAASLHLEHEEARILSGMNLRREPKKIHQIVFGSLLDEVDGQCPKI